MGVVSSERNRVLDRLGKILARTKSANSHEADTARRLADELMARHGLTDADLKKHANAGYHELSLGHAGFNATWKFTLVTAAARYSGCEAVALQSGRRRRVRLVGERAAVERAAVLFEALLRLLRDLESSLGDYLADLDDVDLDGSPRQCADSFRRGAVASIVSRLVQSRPDRFGRQGGRSRRSDGFGGAGADVKSLVLGDRRTEHAERIRQKYAPRMKHLDLEDAPSLSWYWMGHDAADRLVMIPDNDARDGKDG